MKALKIILPNPFAILTQETMKTFLNNRMPREKFQLVQRGTGLTEIREKVASLKDRHASLELKQQSMQRVL